MGMYTLAAKSSGQVGYEAYLVHMGSADKPSWDNLSTNEQDAWDAAGDEIIEDIV